MAKFSNKIDFIGNEVDINKTGNAFLKIIGSESCLFPISNISKRTIQKHLNPINVFDCVVYHTKATNTSILPYFDVLIFTSPSNVEQYFKKNSVMENQIYIAMGPTTGIELQKNGIDSYLVPEKTGEIGLIDVLSNKI